MRTLPARQERQWRTPTCETSGDSADSKRDGAVAETDPGRRGRDRPAPCLPSKQRGHGNVDCFPFTASNGIHSRLPVEALFTTPRVESFCWRVEERRDGGFAVGEPGAGKSVVLRLLANRLTRNHGGCRSDPSNLADFYREMGELFEAPLRPHKGRLQGAARALAGSP